MRVVIFCHSLLSDWNHGNAHFLRGICSELLHDGHDVAVWEPADAWSLRNLLIHHGEASIEAFHRAYPSLQSTRYDDSDLDLDFALENADVVLVHEWNKPSLVERIGDHRKHAGQYTLLFHDTHHRSVTDPEAMSRFELSGYDGVLAFGASVAEVYRRHGWGRRVCVWHEAADTRVFRPLEAEKEGDLVWIGNWGDEERTAELQEYLIDPAARLGLRARFYGVRYPMDAQERLTAAGIDYAGWTPNFAAPRIFASYCLTAHVPRRPYATALPGVPTIRMFEALACGIPLVSAPWSDSENLFTPGKDFLYARDGSDMEAKLEMLLEDTDQAREQAAHGLQTILARHTCAHRVKELYGILEQVQSTAVTMAGGVN